RRRHTRFSRDWSSDVCSSDLHLPLGAATKYPSSNPSVIDHFQFTGLLTPQEEILLQEYGKVFFYEVNVYENGALIQNFVLYPNEIGRASCRERVEYSEVDAS